MKTDSQKIEHWDQENNYLTRTITFKNFKEALKAMNLIGDAAEEINHHPNWSNSYNKLEIKLFTHTTGGITDLDFKLAIKINDIISDNF